jgi:exodeoxyribonuclease VII large subunit
MTGERSQLRTVSYMLPRAESSLFDLPLVPFAAALSVTEMTQYLSGLLEADELLQDAWVRGEVSAVTYHGSGHVYFTLKDEESCLRCVIWRNDARRLRFRLEPGMGVLVHGRVAVYEKRGEYQLIADTAEPEGVGSLYLAFEQLRQSLAEEGLFDPARKRAIPVFARRVAVVTSPTGAAIQDICTIVRRRCPVTSILVVPALVQGDGAPASLCAALARVNELKEIDVVVLARGGGSLEDLWPFNTEAVARAIAASRAPVVSAIGHETDFTIADFVADLRAPTPSAAAEILAPDLAQLETRLAMAKGRLIESLRSQLAYAGERLAQLQSRRVLARPGDEAARRQQRLDDLHDRLERAAEHSLERGRLGLRAVCGRLEALSPVAILARGYAVALRLPERSVIGSASVLKPGDRFAVRFHDGEIPATVEGAASSPPLSGEGEEIK